MAAAQRGQSTFFGVGMCLVDFRLSVPDLKNRVTGTEKNEKMRVHGTKILAHLELIWADFELILGYFWGVVELTSLLLSLFGLLYNFLGEN